jgi:hypothetical protein
MEVEPRGGLTVYPAQEFEKLQVTVASETFPDDSSLKHKRPENNQQPLRLPSDWVVMA